MSIAIPSEDIFSWACRNRYGVEPPWPESIAISGPREIRARAAMAQVEAIRHDFEQRIEGICTIYSGAAYGVDTIGAEVARETNANLILVTPQGKHHNHHLYELADEIIHVEGGYLARDERLADEADALIAYPRTSNEERRSGTWATIRYFQKRGKPVTIVPLDVLC